MKHKNVTRKVWLQPRTRAMSLAHTQAIDHWGQIFSQIYEPVWAQIYEIQDQVCSQIRDDIENET